MADPKLIFEEEEEQRRPSDLVFEEEAPEEPIFADLPGLEFRQTGTLRPPEEPTVPLLQRPVEPMKPPERGLRQMELLTRGLIAKPEFRGAGAPTPPTPEEPVFDELGLPVGEPVFGAEAVEKTLGAFFAPLQAVLESPGAFTEADIDTVAGFEAAREIPAIERTEASILGAVHAIFKEGTMAGEIAIRKLAKPEFQEVTPEQLDAMGDVGGDIAQITFNLLAMHFFATGVTRLTKAGIQGAQAMTEDYILSRGFAPKDAENLARFFTDNQAAETLHRTMAEHASESSRLRAARLFEEKYGFRSPNDPRGRATRTETKAARDAAKARAEEKTARRKERKAKTRAAEEKYRAEKDAAAARAETAEAEAADFRAERTEAELRAEAHEPPLREEPIRQLEFAEEARPGEVPPEPEIIDVAPEPEVIEVPPAGPAEPVLSAKGTPFKTERGAASNIPKIAKQFAVPAENLEVVPVVEGFGIIAKGVEVSPPKAAEPVKEPVKKRPTPTKPKEPVIPQAAPETATAAAEEVGFADSRMPDEPEPTPGEKPTKPIEEKTVFESTKKTAKKDATTWIDATIKAMQGNQIKQGGSVTMTVGKDTFQVPNTIAGLTSLKENLGKPKKKVKPPDPKEITRAAPDTVDYLPMSVAPKGATRLWTDGQLIDTGDRPPKGKQLPFASKVSHELVDQIFQAAKVHVNKPNRKAVRIRFARDPNTKRPALIGSLINKAGEEIPVKSSTVGYFLKKYPDAQFFFKPDFTPRQDQVPIINEQGEITGHKLVARDDGIGDIAVVSKGEYVGMFKSFHETTPVEAKVNEAGEAKQHEVGKTEAFDDKGPYERQYAYDSSGTQTGAGDQAANLQAIIDLPQMVDMAQRLMGGKFPQIVKYIDKQGTVLGRFYGAGLGKIVMRADLFEDLDLARAVLAHEIGHIWDWLPEGTFTRGNIFGRIMSFSGKFGKQVLPRLPGGKEELTPKDRRRLQRQAEKIIKEEYKDKWIDEVIKKTMPINPQDVLNIWNAVETADLTNPELVTFIKELTTVEKKAVVKQALKGAVATELKQFAKTVKKKTGRKIKAEIPKDARAKKYAELLDEEIRKLRLFKAEEVMDELKTLSRKWKPFDPARDPKYTAYRYRGRELYADAISVLFNAPGMLRSTAPNFYDGLMNYLQLNPKVHDLYKQIQDDINTGRTDDQLEDAWYSDMDDGDLAYGIKLEKRVPLWDQFNKEIIDQHWAVIKPVKRWFQAGLSLPGEQNPQFAVENMIMQGAEQEWLIGRMQQRVIRPLENVGLNWNNFGFYKGLKRIISNPDAQKAAPRGTTPEWAAKKLKELETERWAGKKWETMVAADEAFTETISEIQDQIEASEIWPDEVIEQMRDKVKDYVTFEPVEWAGKNLGPSATASIFPRLGSFKPITNPATATLLKHISIMKATNRKRMVKTGADFQFKYQKQFPDQGTQIVPAEKRWNGEFMETQPPKDPRLGLIGYMEKGKYKGFYVDKFYADAFAINPIEGMLFTRVLGALANPFRQVFTDLNPGFWLYNTVFRDLLRAATVLPKANLPKMIKFWTKGIKPGFRRVYGIPDDIIDEMLKDNMLISIESARGLSPTDSETERLLARARITPLKWNQVIVKPFSTALNFWGNIGRAGETAGKVASYLYLKETFPDMDKDTMRHLVMSRGGSPAFLRLGSAAPILNNLILFSNAFKEGHRSEFESMFEDPWQFWFKRFKYLILPKILMLTAAWGYWGDDLQRVFSGVSDFDMANYLVIPLGLSPQGKSVYLRVPTDEGGRLIGGVIVKMLQQDEDKNLTQLLDYMAGQAPTLNPAISAFISTMQYVTGQNPYDSFRGRYAIPQEIWRAQDEHTREAFAKWLANKYGGNLVYRFKHDELEKVQTELEEVLNYPFLSNILGRFVKVSDVGVKAKLKIRRELIKRENARLNLDAKDALTQWLNDPSKMQVDDWIALAKKPDALDRNMVRLIARKYGDTVAEELWSVYQTGTFEEKMSIWSAIQELNLTDVPGDSFRWLWQRDRWQGSRHKKEWTWEEVSPDARPRR